jgi:hypothetical protein
MSHPLPCLRRTEPSAALIPHAGQKTLAYVPAARSDIRKRIHELNRYRIVALEAHLARGFVNRAMQVQPRPNEGATLQGVADVPS